MKTPGTTFQILLAGILACTIIGFPRFACSAEQKIALVIGNAAYPTSRLRNPVNDAKAMAGRLQALGFDVILKTDTSQREMTRAFSQFGQKLALGSVGLFYYAGHGMQVQGKNFLIPVDAEIETEASVRTEAVDVDQLLHQLGPARLSMVILDACRNNPFERRFRGAGGGLAQIDAPTGTLLAYATAPGKVAADGTGSNGLYTEALLKALDMPGLKVEDIFKQVRINVVKASDGTQTPWESSSLTGEFYFTPDNKPALADEKFKQSERERAELAKALDEERKKREKDAELVRAEMEKLRAELMKIRTDATATQPAIAAQAAESDKKRQEALAKAAAEAKRQEDLARAEDERRKKEDLARAEAERKRQEELDRAEADLKKQQALAKAENDRKQRENLARAEADLKQKQELAKAETERKQREDIARAEELRRRQEALAKADAELKKQQALAQTEAKQPASAANPTVISANAQPTQIAMIQMPGTVSSTTSAWSERIALLEKFRGQLTFSKALALLFDINTAADLTLLLVREGELRNMPWNSAYAIGTDADGNLIMGGGYRWQLRAQAIDTAVEQCAGPAKLSCKVLVINGEFRETEFRELAAQLGKQSVSNVRQQYLLNLGTPLPLIAPSNSQPGNVNAHGFSSARK